MRLVRVIKLKWVLLGLAAAVVLFGLWIAHLDRALKKRLKEGWFEQPIEFYSESESIVTGQILGMSDLESRLRSIGFIKIEGTARLLAGQYQILDDLDCAKAVDSPFLENTATCLQFRNRSDEFKLVAFTSDNHVSLLFSGEPLQEQTQLETPPHLFAQFLAGQPILRSILQIGEVPLQCLQAVTAAEDADFLEHKGISPTGLLRATVKNLFSGRYAQGGSTITQQLVKNYFLSPEKTLQRKITELLMAFLLELRVSKDQILENYLNVIYLGQNGPFQVIGFKAASDFYFNKELERLDLPECALLAAIINSPGRYNPSLNPENASNRRNFVLGRMHDLNLISDEDFESSKKTNLPKKISVRLSEPAAYFTQASFRELEELGVNLPDGGRIFTTMNEAMQDDAQRFTEKHVENIEGSLASIQKLKASGKNLEAALISVEQNSGAIRALVGGRKYTKTQFNRILDGHRQVGSLMKPFVALAALTGSLNPPIDPMTEIVDEPFTYKYQGQFWSPKNYDKKFHGSIPFYVALKDSINIPFVKIGIQAGLSNIVQIAKDMGVTSTMEPFPSLTLGAFEIRPIELAQSYATIANFGLYRRLHTVTRVEDFNGSMLYSFNHEPELRSPPPATAVLVGMMKQTIDAGTASYARKAGFILPAAGKTGTTSDTKDAWFVGFTPQLLTLTWTGYDDNTPSGLTGASGALPLWIRFNQKVLATAEPKDFQWPEGTHHKDGLIFVDP